MMRGRLMLLVFALVVASAVSGCGQASPAAPVEPPDPKLLARLRALEELIPDQSHIMADVSDHFANLWFAGLRENWPLADFYLAETKSHLRWAVRRIPVRKDGRGQDVILGNILQAFENSQLAALKTAVDREDKAAFEKVYRECLTVCYSCHKASDKPYLRPQIPIAPASPMINFDPHAQGP